jgi:hypothetical protein
MEIVIVAPSILLSLLLVLHSTAAARSAAMAPAAADELAPSALGPAADEHISDVYIVFVSRDDYVDSVDYDVRLLASVIGRSLLLTCSGVHRCTEDNLTLVPRLSEKKRTLY